MTRWHASILLLVFSLLACTSGPNEPVGATSAPSFEAWADDVPREPGPHGVYIVDGDTPAPDLHALRRFYDRHVTGRDHLTVHRHGGEDSIWDRGHRFDLSYCVSRDFGDRYDAVVTAFEDATSAWEEVGLLDFDHREEEDGRCDASNDAVLFHVEPANEGLYLARAFFPHFTRVQRAVRIDDTAFDGHFTLAGIVTHELGHVLGFRHEHIRPEAGATACREDDAWRAVTPYDSESVMHYPQCNGTATSLRISEKDALGAAELYGPARRTRHGETWISPREQHLFGPWEVATGTPIEVTVSSEGATRLSLAFDAPPTPDDHACQEGGVAGEVQCVATPPEDASTVFVLVEGDDSLTGSVPYRLESEELLPRGVAGDSGVSPDGITAHGWVSDFNWLRTDREHLIGPIATLGGTLGLSFYGVSEALVGFGEVPTDTSNSVRYLDDGSDHLSVRVPAGQPEAYLLARSSSTLYEVAWRHLSRPCGHPDAAPATLRDGPETAVMDVLPGEMVRTRCLQVEPGQVLRAQANSDGAQVTLAVRWDGAPSPESWDCQQVGKYPVCGLPVPEGVSTVQVSASAEEGTRLGVAVSAEGKPATRTEDSQIGQGESQVYGPFPVVPFSIFDAEVGPAADSIGYRSLELSVGFGAPPTEDHQACGQRRRCAIEVPPGESEAYVTVRQTPFFPYFTPHYFPRYRLGVDYVAPDGSVVPPSGEGPDLVTTVAGGFLRRRLSQGESWTYGPIAVVPGTKVRAGSHAKNRLARLDLRLAFGAPPTDDAYACIDTRASTDGHVGCEATVPAGEGLAWIRIDGPYADRPSVWLEHLAPTCSRPPLERDVETARTDLLTFARPVWGYLDRGTQINLPCIDVAAGETLEVRTSTRGEPRLSIDWDRSPVAGEEACVLPVPLSYSDRWVCDLEVPAGAKRASVQTRVMSSGTDYLWVWVK